MSELLRPVDAARILARAAGVDGRDPSPLADESWCAALNRAGLTFADFRDCLEAVDEHYAATTDRVMPAHVVAIVKARRREVAERRQAADRLALTAGRPAEGSPEAQGVLSRLSDAMARTNAARNAILAEPEARPCRYRHLTAPGGPECGGTVAFDGGAMLGTCTVCGAQESRFSPGYGLRERGFTAEGEVMRERVNRGGVTSERVPSRVQARDEPCADPDHCDIHNPEGDR